MCRLVLAGLGRDDGVGVVGRLPRLGSGALQGCSPFLRPRCLLQGALDVLQGQGRLQGVLRAGGQQEPDLGADVLGRLDILDDVFAGGASGVEPAGHFLVLADSNHGQTLVAVAGKALHGDAVVVVGPEAGKGLDVGDAGDWGRLVADGVQDDDLAVGHSGIFRDGRGLRVEQSRDLLHRAEGLGPAELAQLALENWEREREPDGCKIIESTF